MGAIVDRIRRLLPGSYRAMLAGSNPFFQANDFQALADYTKFRLFATNVDPELEQNYPLDLQDFVGKVATLNVIPAAIDYWGDQPTSVVITGTSEDKRFPDRLAGLKELYNVLLKQVDEEYPAMAEEYGLTLNRAAGSWPQVSYGDNGKGILLTPDPESWPPQHSWWDVWTTPGVPPGSVAPWELVP
jgi:hypothetical protein